MILKNSFFLSLLFFTGFLISCGNSNENRQIPASNPNDEKIDRKTYSTAKDIWIADEVATCGNKKITSNPNMSFGIDLSQNFYWEVMTTKEGGNNCRTRHVYLIDVSKFKAGLESSVNTQSIPAYSESGILVPQTYRKKCTDLASDRVVSDTGDIADSFEEHRTIHVFAMKTQLLLTFEKDPMCQGDYLTLRLSRQ
ncbi:MAG: hypothetical protein ACXVCY_11375 [Pseudobdellovibrionaceae bacterium]